MTNTTEALDQIKANEANHSDNRLLEFALKDVDDALDDMTNGYLEALLWTSNPNEDGQNLLELGYGIDDIPKAVRDGVRDLFRAVVACHPLAVRLYGVERQGSCVIVWEHFGHDFLLTRDGHGAGFWDRGLGELGEHLSQIARPLGDSEYLYVSEDGTLEA